MSYRSGHCTAKYSPGAIVGGSPSPSYASIGSSETGFRIRRSQHFEPIRDDAYGQAMPDGVNMGADTFVDFTFVDYNLIKAVVAAFGALASANDNVGKLMSGCAGPLCITPIANTPNATEIGAGNSRIF